MRTLPLLTLLVALLLTSAAVPAATAAPTSAKMAYCTPADVAETYDAKTLAQRTGDPTGVTVDADKLESAVDGFASIMAPYVRGRYPAVDFGQAEPTLKTINVEGAWLDLAKRKPLGLSKDERDQRADLLRQLRDIAGGGLALTLPDAVDPDVGSIDPATAFRSNPRQFGRRTWTPPRS
jgi:phage gp36-like protein